MPSRNTIKHYGENFSYHIYTRGVDKTNIFINEKDYNYFIYLMERLLTKPNDTTSTRNFYSEISLHSFCLLQNHFHFQLTQKNEWGMQKFMHSLLTSYVGVFNQRHGRVGPLFQSRYKARVIKYDEDFINTSKYIHRNPSENNSEIITYPYSSLKNYSPKNKIIDEFVKTEKLLSYFESSKVEYKKYILEN